MDYRKWNRLRQISIYQAPSIIYLKRSILIRQTSIHEMYCKLALLGYTVDYAEFPTRGSNNVSP